MQRLNEAVKADIGLIPQTLNNSNATGQYYSLKDYRRACAVLIAGATAATKTTKLEVLEAQDNAGSGAALIAGATATVTASAAVTEMTLTLATVIATNTITINGLTFTAHATVTTPADREFSISGNDTSDAAELVTCINDSVYGVPGVTATSAAGVVTLKADPRGETTLTVTESGGTITLATTQHAAYVEVGELQLSSGFDHIACKVTTTGNTPLGVVLLRDPKVFPAGQQVGASATV